MINCMFSSLPSLFVAIHLFGNIHLIVAITLYFMLNLGNIEMADDLEDNSHDTDRSLDQNGFLNQQVTNLMFIFYLLFIF